MISDSFLDLCILIIANKSRIEDKILFRDISDIISSVLTYYKQDDIPVTQKNKLTFIKKFSELILNGKTRETAIDSLSLLEKYKPVIDIIQVKNEHGIHEDEINNAVNQIRLRKKLNFVVSNYERLEKILSGINGSSFESLDDAITHFEDTVKMLYSNISEQNKILSVQACSSLDLRNDDYNSVIEKIISKYSQENVTPTGFRIFDNKILNGGFEPSRLYILAGAAGSGKSTLLCNFMTESIKVLRPRSTCESNVYVYITLENTIEEALMRIYQSIFMKTTAEVLTDIDKKVDFKSKIVERLEKNNSTIIMKYFSPSSISCTDIAMVLQELKDRFGKNSIRGLYLDYLDLLRTDIHYDVNWIEIGHIALGLKALAVEYNIPIVSPTHLNSSSYGTLVSKDLNLSQMSKSIQKVEHADFVLLMVRDNEDESIVHIKVGKNRNGPSGTSIEFSCDFQHFKFVDAYQNSVNNTNSLVKTKSDQNLFDNLSSASYL